MVVDENKINKLKMAADQNKIKSLILSKNELDRLIAARLLKNEFESLPNKSSAWSDLIFLTKDTDSYIRMIVTSALASAFYSLPDKSAAWDDLHRLTSNEESNVRKCTADALGYALEFVNDKSAVWADIHTLIDDSDLNVRKKAIFVFVSAFSFIPEENKPVAWADLIRLTSEEDEWIIKTASDALFSAFSSIQDKSVAWTDLIKLTNSTHLYVREKAVYARDSFFRSIPETYKFAVWNDIDKLTKDEDFDVRRTAAAALGSIFPILSEENRSAALDDLSRLTQDWDQGVRMYANHSLGKICIYNASQSENEIDSINLLTNAIRYFEKGAKETTKNNPAKFCNRFYRTFYAVIFNKVSSKNEIKGYIAAAKEEIKGSESKQKLVEAVEQLAEALEIAHNAHVSGKGWQETIKNCSYICNHVDWLMDENKDKTPSIHNLYKKTKPLFDETIKKLIDEVKEKAEVACKEAMGTPAQKTVCNIKIEIQELKIGSQEYLKKQILLLYKNLKLRVPERDEYMFLHQEIDSVLKEDDLVYQYSLLNDIFLKIIEVTKVETRTSVLEEMKTYSITPIQKDISDIKMYTTEINYNTKIIIDNLDQIISSIMKQPNPQEYLDTIQQIMEQIMDKLQKNNENTELKEKINKVLYQLRKPEKIEFKLKFTLPLIPKVLALETEKNVSDIVYEDITKLKSLINKLNR